MTDSRGLLVESLGTIIQPARLLTKKHFPKAQALGDEWENECPGAKMAVLPSGGTVESFVTLSELPGNPQDWNGYLRGKLRAVMPAAVYTSMSVRNPMADPPIYGGGFCEAVLKRGYAPELIDDTVGDSALTGGYEVWDQAILATGVMCAFGKSDALLQLLDWNASGVAACAQEEGLDRVIYENFTLDAMGLLAI